MRRSIVEENRKWRWSDIGVWMKNSVQAIIKGQFLMRLGFNKYFIHIIYTFFLFWVSIWLSLNWSDSTDSPRSGTSSMKKAHRWTSPSSRQ